MQSDLEFQLRLQECIELMKSRSYSSGISYARKHLSSGSTAEMTIVQRVMTLLMLDRAPPSLHARYSDLTDPERWDRLIDAFRLANFELHYLPPAPILDLVIHAGLCSLKTP